MSAFLYYYRGKEGEERFRRRRKRSNAPLDNLPFSSLCMRLKSEVKQSKGKKKDESLANVG